VNYFILLHSIHRKKFTLINCKYDGYSFSAEAKTGVFLACVYDRTMKVQLSLRFKIKRENFPKMGSAHIQNLMLSSPV